MKIVDVLSLLFIGTCFGSIGTLIVQILAENVLPRFECLL